MRELFLAFLIPVIVYTVGLGLKSILDSKDMLNYHQEMVIGNLGD